MDPLALQPQMHSPIAVGFVTSILMLFHLLSQSSVLFCRPHSAYIGIVAASRYTKKLTHNRDGIFRPVTINNLILEFVPHILSVSERKSRNNSFSIFSLLFSYLYSCSVLAGLRPLNFGMVVPLFLARSNANFTTDLSLKPKCSAISLCVIPSATIACMVGTNSFICV